MNKSQLRNEIAKTEKQLRDVKSKLDDYIRSIPCVIKTKYVDLQVSPDIFKVKDHEAAAALLKSIKENKYANHSDWRMPTFADCFLLKNAGFNFYNVDVQAEFLVKDGKDKAFCKDGTQAWLSNYSSKTALPRVFFVRRSIIIQGEENG